MNILHFKVNVDSGEYFWQSQHNCRIKGFSFNGRIIDIHRNHSEITLISDKTSKNGYILEIDNELIGFAKTNSAGNCISETGGKCVGDHAVISNEICINYILYDDSNIHNTDIVDNDQKLFEDIEFLKSSNQISITKPTLF